MLELQSDTFRNTSIGWVGEAISPAAEPRHGMHGVMKIQRDVDKGSQTQKHAVPQIHMHFHLNMHAVPRASGPQDGLPDPADRCSFEKCCSQALTHFLEQHNRFNRNDVRCI